MIESKHNKSALSKYKTLLKKERKTSEILYNISNRKKELLESVSYPIFIKISDASYVAHLGIDKKITVTNHSFGYSNKKGYSIHVDEEKEKRDSLLYEYEIKYIDNRITKKEFMLIYNKALIHIKELMALSTRSRKTILVEKTIMDGE